jgi:DNA-binding NarL/FixJ family response regulator
MQAYFLSSDLMFASRVQSAAAAVGVSLAVRGLTLDGLSGALADGADATLVVADLSSPGGLDVATLPALIRRQCPAARVIAFAPHVHVNMLEQARAAGFDEVLTRGQFNERIADLLRQANG